MNIHAGGMHYHYVVVEVIVQNLKEFYNANFFNLQKCCFLEKILLAS